ncbi:hypothetical protein LY78DRAFT_683922 [Colletotrichum sublineola]|nr:hypothetical protein LY78DRAFT_683922 [Colletotrichum sublineola]
MAHCNYPARTDKTVTGLPPKKHCPGLLDETPSTAPTCTWTDQYNLKLKHPDLTPKTRLQQVRATAPGVTLPGSTHSTKCSQSNNPTGASQDQPLYRGLCQLTYARLVPDEVQQWLQAHLQTPLACGVTVGLLLLVPMPQAPTMKTVKPPGFSTLQVIQTSWINHSRIR